MENEAQTDFSAESMLESVPQPDVIEEPPRERPQVTFRGNSYDLAALAAAASGGLLLFSCLTCNMGMYCLPFLPVVLGAIGLLKAQQAVDKERTRLWSWLGLGAGAAMLVLFAVGVVLYLVFLFVMIGLSASQ